MKIFNIPLSRGREMQIVFPARMTAAEKKKAVSGLFRFLRELRGG
jgi:hypothetical protein